MTPQETALLEAARSACLAAINATQGACQVIEAVLGTSDHVEPDKPDWGTFDDSPETPTTEQSNGRQGKRPR